MSTSKIAPCPGAFGPPYDGPLDPPKSTPQTASQLVQQQAESMHGMHAMRPEHMLVSVIFTVYTRKMPFLLLPPVDLRRP